jgi:protoporphyrinogen oxidase
MESPIIILGAGAAGLAAAKELADQGREIVIVEARNRIGGRIHTLRDPKLKIPIELGAEFIHGRPESTWRIIHRAGLHAFDLPFEHKRLRAGRVVEMPDMDKALAKVMGGLAHLGRRDQSFADYLRRYHAGGSQADARKFALSFVEGFDAADPERISAQSLAAEQKGIGDVDAETQFRLLDGYGSLIE